MWDRLRSWWAYQQGMMLRFWGHKMVRRQLYEASAAAFTRALLWMPDRVDACMARGLIYWRELRELDRAIADFSTVFRLDSTRGEALFYRGMAYQALGDYATAAEDIRAALRQSPDALWRHNAFDQLQAIEAILEDLPAHLADGEASLLPSGVEPPSLDGDGMV